MRLSDPQRVTRELGVFVESVIYYFEQVAAQQAEVGSPYLVDTRAQIGKDYTGIITISGRRRGIIYFTAPRGMLSALLMQHGETEISHELMCDLVGEVANTISGNVRRDFGHGFVISVPRVVTGEPDPAQRPASTRSFVVPINWRNYEARLVVALQ